MAVQPDVEKKGFLRSAATAADDVFTRITAGIDAGEFRRMLRGEPPGRPNPRLKPHSEAFLLHIKPTYYHESVTRFTHTFRLGLLSTYLFFFETITGMFLMIWYAPSPDRAYSDMIYLLSNVPYGQFMRDLHRLGAEMMVAIVTLHMVRTYLTGSYKAPRQFTWFTGVVLLVVTLFLSFSGYLLPWDQLAFWAVTIGTSMAEAVPPAIVGETVNLLARGAPDIGANGLLRFYLLHVLFLPLVLFLFFFVHYYKVVHFGISLPAHEEEVGQDTANKVPADRRVYFLPDVFLDETMFLIAFTAICVVISAFFFAAPLESIANPQVTPLHTVAPWYFYWLQGMLKIADKTIAGVILPGVLLVLLIGIPYLDPNPSRRAKDRRVAIISGVVAGAVMIVLSWMGTPQYAAQAAPAVEVVQELMPEEGAGLVREVGYDEIPVGVYDTRDDLAAMYPEEEYHGLHEILVEFEDSIRMWQRQDPDFNEAYGVLTVTQDQPQLRRLDWQINWLDANGEANTFERHFFLHQDSMYWEEYGLKDFSFLRPTEGEE
ncbi:MAG: cytochrome bc complex cytochrome b subunit [Caldilineaceae bacterium]|nr:cytochrome bc complex cytochrome b subunit [Caldilineaceae bacterium]MCB9158815.1 cytochrome bc complex cytochrome b subunit [Caldilineaceae bacterium]